MSEIIGIVNQKGGTGKSTTAMAIGQVLALKKKKVLFIDMDAQGNMTYALNVQDVQNVQGSMYALASKTPIKSLIHKTPFGDILPSDTGLSSADLTLIDIGKEYRLKELLKPLKSSYDYIIVDTSPALGILTVNALTASDSIIIPAQADIFSLQGIGQLTQTIQAVQNYSNPDLKIKGIVLTRYNPRTCISRDITTLTKQTAEMLGTKVYKTAIRECVSVKEAQAEQKSLFEYAPKCTAALDYKELVKEIING